MVKFLCGLVIQIGTVHDKDHLMNLGEFSQNLRRLKAGQGLAGASGMPNIARLRLFLT